MDSYSAIGALCVWWSIVLEFMLALAPCFLTIVFSLSFLFVQFYLQIAIFLLLIGCWQLDLVSIGWLWILAITKPAHSVLVVALDSGPS